MANNLEEKVKNDRRVHDHPLDSLREKISISMNKATQRGVNINDKQNQLAALKKIGEILVKIELLAKDGPFPDAESQLKLKKLEAATAADVTTLNKQIETQISELHLPTTIKNLNHFAREHLWVLKFVDKKFDPDGDSGE